MSRASAGDLLSAAARRDPARARAALRARLEERRAELEQALLTRLYGIADPTEVGDLAYLEGLRSAAPAAVDFALATIESNQDRLPLVPPALLTQARLAARNAIGLDTVLRRYTAGHALLVDFLIAEIEHGISLPPAELRRLLAVTSSAFDRLLVAVSEEHARESEGSMGFSRERRFAERVERLLAGEPIGIAELDYDFTTEHVGLVASGEEAESVLRGLAAALDRQLLITAVREHTHWAWLGGRRPIDDEKLTALLEKPRGRSIIAVGEPLCDLAGWRLTHRQAKAALIVAQRGHARVARYADVALLASILQDDLLAASLRQLYLEPLESERDGGETLRQTLRAYLKSGRNAASTAAALGVSRQTINNRLRAIEGRIKRSIHDDLAPMDAVLQLHELDSSA